MTNFGTLTTNSQFVIEIRVYIKDQKLWQTHHLLFSSVFPLSYVDDKWRYKINKSSKLVKIWKILMPNKNSFWRVLVIDHILKSNLSFYMRFIDILYEYFVCLFWGKNFSVILLDKIFLFFIGDLRLVGCPRKLDIKGRLV